MKSLYPSPPSKNTACIVPSGLGGYVNSTCTAGAQVTQGTSCTYQCTNGASGVGTPSFVTANCVGINTWDTQMPVGIQCEAQFTCGQAYDNSVYTCTGGAPQQGPNRTATCSLGSPATPARPCDATNCCTGLLQCSSAAVTCRAPDTVKNSTATVCNPTIAGDVCLCLPLLSFYSLIVPLWATPIAQVVFRLICDS